MQEKCPKLYVVTSYNHPTTSQHIHPIFLDRCVSSNQFSVAVAVAGRIETILTTD
jgi:hypothetical protein